MPDAVRRGMVDVLVERLGLLRAAYDRVVAERADEEAAAPGDPPERMH